MVSSISNIQKSTRNNQKTGNKVSQEVVSLEVYNLNHAVMNNKKEIKYSFFFFRKKKLEKGKWSAIKWDNRFINNRLYLKILIVQRNGEKN